MNPVDNIAIIVVSPAGISIAETLSSNWNNCAIYTTHNIENSIRVKSVKEATKMAFEKKYEAIMFIGALGICVRSIAPFIKDKYNDPAVINIDSTGMYVVSVLSGHIGGGNELATKTARILGGREVISTLSDRESLWALDTLGNKWNWATDYSSSSLNKPITSFTNKKPTALLLDIRDDGTDYLERTKPNHVDIFYDYSDIDSEKYTLIIAVTFRVYTFSSDTLYFRPKVLHIGMGCRKNCSNNGEAEIISNYLKHNCLSPLSVASISTIDLKKDEQLIQGVASYFDVSLNVYTPDMLQDIQVLNPSDKVKNVTSLPGVAETTSVFSAHYGELIVPKQKGIIKENQQFTFAIALDDNVKREGFIHIVGAGPGDPELISVRGKHLLGKADLILYAGSLVPIELTHYAKPGCTVRSSADMNLEEQFELMKEFYDKKLIIVRLHTGDPCIYGAIQEQMALFDNYDMKYDITPGISSFLAAAAKLKSQFTIPEEVQTIILTRGEGRTPMPEKEKLHLLARSQSTMCIFLSASIVDQVQAELLQHYPPSTPVAACYKLTWKDERIYRGELKDLAKIVKENSLTLTTLLVVGKAIDNREGRSKLYEDKFKHLFRK